MNDYLNKTIINRITVKRFIVICIYISAAAALLWKIPYGWGAYDEPFYISMPFRFAVSGDCFFSDEWNLAQLSSFILIIPVKLYSKLFPDMEGVILFFRAFYTILHIVESTVLICLLKDRGSAAWFAAIFYLLFVPFNIMNFSYDAVGLACITIMSVLIYSKPGPGRMILFVIGFLYAFAVLCNPYLVIPFLMLFICSIISGMKKYNIPYLNLKDFLWIISGILLPAMCLTGFIFSRTTINEILVNLPELLNDPTHGGSVFIDRIKATAASINDIFGPWIYIWIAITLIQILDRGRMKRKKLYLVLSALIFAGSLMGFIFNVRVNCYMLPFALYGINLYLITQNKDRRIIYLWISGPVYGFFMWLASDQNIYIITMAMSVSVIGTILSARDLYRENDIPPVKYILCVVLFLQFGMEITGLTRSTHWEAERIENLNAVYERGPLKGLITTADKVKIYEMILEDIGEYKENTDSRIAFMMLNTWEYLYVERPYGTFSPWLGYTDTFMADKFLNWCRLHPDKIPEDIYFSKLEETGWKIEDIEKIAEKLGFDISESNTGYKLSKPIN